MRGERGGIAREIGEEGREGRVCSGDAVGSNGTSVGCDTRTERRAGGEELIVFGGGVINARNRKDRRVSLLCGKRGHAKQKDGCRLGRDQQAKPKDLVQKVQMNQTKTTAGSFKGTGPSKQSGAV